MKMKSQVMNMTRRHFLSASLSTAGVGTLVPRAFGPLVWPEAGGACAVLVLLTAACAAVAIAHYCRQRFLVVFSQESEREPLLFSCVECMSASNLAAAGYTPCLGEYVKAESCVDDAAKMTAVASTNGFAAMPCSPIIRKGAKRLDLQHSTDMHGWINVASIVPTAQSRGWVIATAEGLASIMAEERETMTRQGATLVAHDLAGHGFFREVQTL